MNIEVGNTTSPSVLAGFRRLASEVENLSGTISANDRAELMAAYNSIMLVLESHMGGVA